MNPKIAVKILAILFILAIATTIAYFIIYSPQGADQRLGQGEEGYTKKELSPEEKKNIMLDILNRNEEEEEEGSLQEEEKKQEMLKILNR